MFSATKILVPVDFSDTSRAAISAGLQMAAMNGGTLWLLHVESGMEEEVDQGSEQAADALSQIDTHEAALKAAFDLEVERCVEGGRTLPPVDVQYRVSGGDWRLVANQMVDELQLDLIVTATHGPQGLKERVMGSESERLLSAVTCSVLVVKPKGFPYLRD